MMKIKRKAYNQNQLAEMIICIVVLFTILEPDSVKYNYYIHFVCSGIRLFVGIICLCIFIKRKKFPVFVLGIIPYIIIQFFAVETNHLAWNLYLPEWIGELSAALFFSWMFYRNKKLLLDAVYWLFWLYLLINMLYMIRNPWMNEYEASGFLGGKNAFGPIAICIILVAYIREQYTKDKNSVKWCRLLALVAIVECLWLRSSTSIVGVTCFVGLLICLRYIDEEKKLFVPLYIMQWAMFYAIVIVRVFERFGNLILKILGKDISLTGRTQIWDRTFEYIHNRWLLGYGSSDIVRIVNTWGDSRIRAAHNGVLDLLIVGGVLLLLAYEAYTCFCAFHAETCCKRDVQICVMAWFSFRVLLLAEYYEMSTYFIFLMAMLFYSPKLCELENFESMRSS